MKIRLIVYLVLTLVLAYSCKENNNEIATLSPSKDAQIYSFSLKATHPKTGDSLSRALDSLRFVEFNKTNFAIDQVNGYIYNHDSLPYGLNLKKAGMTLSFNPTFGVNKVEIHYQNPDSISKEWKTTDSVDIPRIREIIITAPDNSTTKTYRINIYVHKVDPDTLPWTKMGTLPFNAEQQKVLLLGNEFHCFSKQGNNIVLHTSDVTNAANWTNETILGLPSNTLLEYITFFKDTWYAITSNGDSYANREDNNWIKQTNNKNVISILGILPGSPNLEQSLLVVFKEDDKFYLGTTSNMLNIEKINKISGWPNNEIRQGFPVLGAVSIQNIQTDPNYNMLILVGGKDRDSKDLNATWLIRKTADGIDVSSSSTNSLFKGSGLSALLYNNQLYTLAENQFYVSESWGASWTTASNKQKLDPAIPVQTHRSVVVDSKNNIWLFGGVTKDGKIYQDVWKGRLNRLNVN